MLYDIIFLFSRTSTKLFDFFPFLLSPINFTGHCLLSLARLLANNPTDPFTILEIKDQKMGRFGRVSCHGFSSSKAVKGSVGHSLLSDFLHSFFWQASF